MPIRHIVLFKFKALVPAAEVQAASNRMVALKSDCLHPETKKDYVKTSVGGANNSPEGKANGFTHAFISEFESEEDRRYYLEEDPVHQAFVKYIGELFDDVLVVDFTPGVF